MSGYEVPIFLAMVFYSQRYHSFVLYSYKLPLINYLKDVLCRLSLQFILRLSCHVQSCNAGNCLTKDRGKDTLKLWD